MNYDFLSAFLQLAQQVTQAERGFVVDSQLVVVDRIAFELEDLKDDIFLQFALTPLRQALDLAKPIVTNNIITDPSKAPQTNTNFSELRIIVGIPLKQIGAVYLEKHIRHGIIPRPTLESIIHLANASDEAASYNLEDLLSRFSLA
ncbi:hypothetical protein MASR2M15_01650 [Anaerolineales bacterium]